MQITSSNRRRNRSENVYSALTYQLTASVKRARFGAMVLADDNGFVVANAGSKGVCEEMAALAPVLAPNMRPWHGSIDTVDGRMRVTIAPIFVNHTQLYLTASEGTQAHLITREMFASATGVGRILA